MRWRILAVSICVAAYGLGAASASAPAPTTPRVRLIPHYTAGQSLYYQFETRTHTAGHTTSAIKDPEGPSQLDQSSTFLVRLDVLDVKTSPQGVPDSVHLRFTYQKISVSTQSDAYDPKVDANEAQLRAMEGKSIEFTVGSDGEVRDVTGMDAIVPNPAIAASMRGWMSGFASASSFPKHGIIVGEKWSSVRPLPDIPLAGVVSRKVSTYLRDEPCGASASLQNDAASPQRATDASRPDATAAAAAAPSGAAPEPEMCAVILTKFEITRDSKTASTTPEMYRKNGLQTKGKWTGSGEGLDSISLRTGLVHSETQNSTQDMDFTISSAGAAHLTYAGNVKSQTQITLLPGAPPPPAQQ
jgi:hypothetical protein